MGKAKLTIEECIKRLSIINPNVVILSQEYVNSKGKLECRCLLDDNIFSMTWGHLSQGKGCKECKFRKQANRNRLTLQEVKDRLYKIDPNIVILSKTYIGADSKLECKCLIDGNKWLVHWGNLSQGKGCPECGNKITRATELFNLDYVKKMVEEIHPTIEVIDSRYITARSPLKCRCNVCSHKWSGTYGNLSAGHGCPQCAIQTSGWTRSKYIERAKGRKCICYKIRCFNADEEFYKIGITSVGVEQRFANATTMPYEYKVVELIEGEAGYIWDLEKELHKQNRQAGLQYKPTIIFGGSTECFSELQ